MNKIKNNCHNILTFNLIILFLVFFIIGMDISFLSAAEDYILSKNNQSRAVIVTTVKSSKQVAETVQTLQSYLYKSTQSNFIIIDKTKVNEFDSHIKIWIGESPFLSKQKLAGLDDDGFIISFPDNKNIVIAGPTDWGTEFGVYEFLEKFVGIRWLIPGPEGEHVPAQTELSIRPVEVNQQPQFMSRNLGGLRDEWTNLWARRNKMHDRIKFHHNLYNLFPPDRYATTHPDFFPIIRGKRFFPGPQHLKKNWQICFSNPNTISVAVNNIKEYFGKHPEATSFSLGVNDSGGFCECPQCLAAVGSKINYLGLKNYSELYYRWANAVVTEVLREYPDKWFGCLAYSQVAEPPAGFSLHPRLLPFITYERLKWLNADNASKMQQLQADWARRATSLGWYDYLYGQPYLIPRIYFQKMTANFFWAGQHNVKAIYAEAYPNWGEGPKMYLILKVLWNPKIDIQATLDEWYTCAVGKKAAPFLEAYFSAWEKIWTQKIAATPWFSIRGQYLRFDDPGYLNVLTYEDIQASRKNLEKVLELAETPQQKVRAELFFRAFEYYEASVISYLGIRKNLVPAGKNKAYIQAMDKRRYELLKEFEANQLLSHSLRFDREDRFKKLIW